MLNDIIFQALTGRAPTTEDRLAALNRGATGGARWIAADSKEAEDLREAHRARAAQAKVDHAAFLDSVRHLRHWADRSKAREIYRRLDRHWLESVWASPGRDIRQEGAYIDWLCRAASINGSGPQWVRHAYRNADIRQSWRVARRGDHRRPFDLAPGQDWTTITAG